MRKLAPLFLTTSIIAFAAGNALAMGDYNKTKKAPEATTSSPKSTNQATPVNKDSSSTGTMRAGEPVATAPAMAPMTTANTTVSANNQTTPVNRDSSSTGTMRAGEPVTTPPGASSSTTGSYNNGSATVAGSTSANPALANDDKAMGMKSEKKASTSTTTAENAYDGSKNSVESTADSQANTSMKPKKAKKKVAKADTTPMNSGTPSPGTAPQ